ncbi:MAG: TAXI family TRAP transporter solute-binding subunit [Candidatus Poribacteria bacterium]|nr:TAXI family TRAP transporter solute-binding subunit [Candidatus Poribacteria bacterium]
MRKNIHHFLHLWIYIIFIGLIFSGCGDKQNKKWLRIYGGVIGGSFSQFAGGIDQIVKHSELDLKISVVASAGSIENTRRVNKEPNTLGVVFASESSLGYHGQEIFAEEGAKTNIRMVTLLYFAYGQFSTLENSNVHKFEDIVGKKIACGAPGSGTAQTLERLARSAGIWDNFKPIYRGGTAGAQELQDGQVKGFLWLVSVPNSAIIELTAIKSIRMLDLDTPAKKYGFYEKYPFYFSGSLPEGAYEGKVEPVKTILMPTVLIANKAIPEETIYAILKHVYAPEGHQTMLQTNQAAADMTIENAPRAFVIPLHSGAYKFWSEQGVEIPARAMPVD